MQVCWSILKKNVRLSKHSWSGLGSPCLSIFQHAIWMWPSNVSLRFFEHSHVMLISSLWTRPPLHLGLKLLVHFDLPHIHLYQLLKPSSTSHITFSKFITKKKNFHPGKQIAKVSNLSKTRCYSNVNFELRCGEIVGITGLVGSGVSHVVRSLAGVNRSDSGHILVDGIAPKNGSLKAHIDAGVALVPGDRKAEGLLLEKSVSWNISLPSIAMTRPRVIINLTWMHTTAQTVMTRLKIKAPHPATLVRNLSGGNQ